MFLFYCLIPIVLGEISKEMANGGPRGLLRDARERFMKWSDQEKWVMQKEAVGHMQFMLLV